MRKFQLLFVLLIFQTSVFGQSISDCINLYESYNEKYKSDDQWPRFDDDEIKTQISELNTILSNLNSLENLSIDDRINKDLLTLIIEDKIFNKEFKTHELCLSAEGGFLAGIVYGVNGVKVSDDKSAKKYIDKLRALPAYIDSRINHLENGMARNVSSPKLIAELCMNMAQEVLDVRVEESFLTAPSRDTEYNKNIVDIVSQEVQPAYKRLIDFLQSKYIPSAPSEIGISSISGGKEYYHQRIRYFATADMTPDEVFRQALLR